MLSANPKNPKQKEVITFIGDDLQDEFKKWRDEAFEVQVGLHELLGHGTGKLLQETSQENLILITMMIELNHGMDQMILGVHCLEQLLDHTKNVVLNWLPYI